VQKSHLLNRPNTDYAYTTLHILTNRINFSHFCKNKTCKKCKQKQQS